MMSSSSFSYPSPCPCPSSSSCSSSSSLWGLRRILRNHLEIEEQEEEEEKEEDGSDKPIDHGLVPSPQSILNPVTLGIYFKREEVPEGEVVFDVGHRAHKVYFIEEGSVEILLVPEVPPGPGPKGVGVTGGNGTGNGTGTGTRGGQRAERVNKISSGGIFGEAAFFMDLPQRYVSDSYSFSLEHVFLHALPYFIFITLNWLTTPS